MILRVPTTKFSPAAHLACCNACNGYVTVKKRFVFVFILGGPAPPEGRGGAHIPRDQKRIAQHDRLMCSQAAARQWSLHTMVTCGLTSRGQLHLMVVHAVVQRLASVCRMCGPRSIAISTSLIACAARVVRGRPLRLPRASLGSVWVVLALIKSLV